MERENFINKIMKFDYDETKGKFYDLFYCHSVTYETNSGDIYLLENDTAFNFILQEINLTRKDYDSLYYIEYQKDVLTYTNVIHNVNHLWKPIDNILSVLENLKKKYTSNQFKYK